MQLPALHMELPSVASEFRLRGGDHPEEVLRFLRFFCASRYATSEILGGHALAGFTVVRANACARSNDLVDKAIRRRIARNLL